MNRKRETENTREEMERWGLLLPPDRRALLGRTVREEIEFALACRLDAWEEVTRRADEVLDRFSLKGMEFAAPASLDSLSERRLNLALAAAHAPRRIYVSDSFADLDPGARAEMERELLRLSMDGCELIHAGIEVDDAPLPPRRKAPSVLSGRLFSNRHRESIPAGSAPWQSSPLALIFPMILLYAITMALLKSLAAVSAAGLLPVILLLVSPGLFKRIRNPLLGLLPLMLALLGANLLGSFFGSLPWQEGLAVWGLVVMKILFVTLFTMGLLLTLPPARLLEGFSRLFAPLASMGFNARGWAAVPVLALREVPLMIADLETLAVDHWKRAGSSWRRIAGLPRLLRDFYGECILGRGQRLTLTLFSCGFGSSIRPLPVPPRDRRGPLPFTWRETGMAAILLAFLAGIIWIDIKIR